MTEVAVIGAGIVGLSVALHLAERGVDVTVLEHSGVAAGQSGVQLGGVRQQWSTPINCEMARESVAVYADLRSRLETTLNPVLERCGYLFVAESDLALDNLRAGVELQQGYGIPSRLVSPAEAADLVPGLDPQPLVGGAWCGEDGHVDRPQSAVEAFWEGARHRGARLRIAEVIALAPNGDGWSLKLAGGESFVAGQVVIAAGYDSPALVAPLGIELPILREARYLFMSEPIGERILGSVVIASERRLAAEQHADGRVIASYLDARDESDADAEDWRRKVRASIRALLPILEPAALPLIVKGLYDVTPDHNAILGKLDAGLWIAAGFNGHGFMMAPATGRVVAAAVVGEEPHPWLRELSFERFADGTPEREALVV